MTEDCAITYFSRIIAIFRIELMDVHFSIQNQWRSNVKKAEGAEYGIIY